MTREEAYEELNISSLFIPKGYSNRPQGKNPAEYITIHETDNDSAGADADAHARYLQGSDARKRRVSWHYTVDSDEVIKHLPVSETAYHAGTAEGNRTSIGIEMCVDGGVLRETVLNRTALLCAVLCRDIAIPVANIVQHNHWSGKNCPSKLRKAKQWDAFISKVEWHLSQLTDE
jgi:N-acetylmuramoyl-L-alanine amidase